MSGKLDQSLDEILSSQKKTRGGGRRGGRTGGRNGKPAAPVGGISKNSSRGGRGGRGAKAVPTGPAAGRKSIGGTNGSKAIISNLPRDVSENQIKEFFQQNKKMPVKRVELAYGPNSQSKGVATVYFISSDGASLALKEMDGILIDTRPIKVEIVVDAKVAAALPGPKGLSERMAQPKAQPKSAASTKASHGTNGAGRGGRGKGRGGRNNGRPTKKTAEELDSEMADYFTGNGNENAAAPANGVANGDAMDEEVL